MFCPWTTIYVLDRTNSPRQTATFRPGARPLARQPLSVVWQRCHQKHVECRKEYVRAVGLALESRDDTNKLLPCSVGKWEQCIQCNGDNLLRRWTYRLNIFVIVRFHVCFTLGLAYKIVWTVFRGVALTPNWTKKVQLIRSPSLPMYVDHHILGDYRGHVRLNRLFRASRQSRTSNVCVYSWKHAGLQQTNLCCCEESWTSIGAILVDE